MLIAGIFAATGALDVKMLLLVGSLGAFAGDLMAYFIGKRFAGSFTKEHRFLKLDYLAKAQSFATRWGSSSVFLGRFIGPLRAFISVVAGMTGVRFIVFCILALLGSTMFISLHVMLGYLAGSAWQTIEAWSSRATILLVGFFVCVAALWWFKNFMIRQGKQLKSIVASFLKSLFEMWVLSAWWKVFSRRFPSFSMRLERRTNPNNFFGLPFLSLILLVLIALIFVIYLGFAVGSNSSFWSNLDLRVISVASLFASSKLAWTAFLVTALCFKWFLSAGVVLTLIWLWLERRYSYILGLLVSVLGSYTAGSILKWYFARPRPAPTYYFENYYSFPSNHAILAVSLFCFIAYYAVRAYPRWSRNVSLILSTIVLAVLIALSRIYLQVHYASDVIAGLFVGLSFLIIGIITQRVFEKNDSTRRLKLRSQLILLSAFLLILILVYIAQVFNPAMKKDFSYIPLTEQTLHIDPAKLTEKNITTENLRGGRKRSIHFIIHDNEQNLVQRLQSFDWQLVPQPTITNIAKQAWSFVTKDPALKRPLRPRFWSNEPNDISLIKKVSRESKTDEYILRLWKARLANNETVFIGEISVNRDFSWPLPPSAEIIINKAQEELLMDFSQQKSFKGFEKIEVPWNADSDEEKQLEKLYIVSL